MALWLDVAQDGASLGCRVSPGRYICCLQGGSLHVLGQKVRGKADSTTFGYETYLAMGIDGNPKPAGITMV